MEPLDEDALIQAAQQGELEAFNQLVLLYQGQVYALAYRLLGNRETAADAAQDTFLAAFQNIQRFRSGSLRAWLLRIATNRCYDLLRRQRSRPSSPLEILFARPEEVNAHRSAPPPETPEQYVERMELLSDIQQALNTLPKTQRLAVILCDIEGFSYREAAETAGISLGTLKSRLSRGRAHLREYFFEHRELLPLSLRSILGGILGESVEG
ncbi:MAG: sigma-70 family RNA polymerase sigma factor [Chloroflexia bacterium]|nr:sigma-70 family RNA polymerase sigma factor [Chloroflexia bacterium]